MAMPPLGSEDRTHSRRWSHRTRGEPTTTSDDGAGADSRVTMALMSGALEMTTGAISSGVDHSVESPQVRSAELLDMA